MIPKIIHYCWFGPGKPSALELKCMASWKKYCPDYHIKLWNEDNFDVNYCEFTKEAYRLGKYAFVSDVARLYALQQEGGVYLDTDMMLVKQIDSFLIEKGFLGAENRILLNGAILGFEPNHFFTRYLLNKYKGISSFNLDDIYTFTLPNIITNSFAEFYKCRKLFESQIELMDIKIFPSSFFYPMPYSKQVVNSRYYEFIKPNSFAVHLWNSSWVDHNILFYIRNKKYKRAIVKMISDYENGLMNINYFKKIIYSMFFDK